jgi:hypothetical protein
MTLSRRQLDLARLIKRATENAPSDEAAAEEALLTALEPHLDAAGFHNEDGGERKSKPVRKRKSNAAAKLAQEPAPKITITIE